MKARSVRHHDIGTAFEVELPIETEYEHKK